MEIDYDKFSEEELEALQKGDYDSMSEKSLRYLSAFEKVDAKVEPTTVEALSTGFVEGVPFMKDAISGVEAIGEEIASEDPLSIDGAVDKYRTKLEEANDTINKAEEMAPIATGVGDFVGSLASLPIGGAKGATAVGALSGLSRSEDRSARDLAAGAALGLGGYGVGQALSKGARSVSNAMSRKAAEMGDESLLGILGANKAGGAQSINRHIKRNGGDANDLLKTIRSKGIVQAGDSEQDILTKVMAAKKESGANIGAFFREVDEVYKPEIPAQSIRNRVESEVASDFLASSDPGTREIGESLISFSEHMGRKSVKQNKVMKHSGKYLPSGAPEMIPEITEEIIDEPFNMVKLHKMQSDITKRIHSIFKRNSVDATAAKEQERLVASKIRNIIDETIEENSPEAIGMLRGLRKTHGNLATVGDLVEDKVAKATQDVTGGLQQFLRSKTVPIALGTVVGGPTGAGIALAADFLIRHPKTPSYIATGMPKVAKLLQVNPAGKMAAKLSAAAHMSSDRFNKALRSVIAEMHLTEDPLPRDIDEVLKRRDDISNYLLEDQPTLYKEWMEVVDNGEPDDVARFMDKVSSTRSGRKFVQNGMGWSGRAYSETDKAAVERQLKNTPMPAAHRQKLLNALRKDGTIPNEEEIPQREPKKYAPSPKNQY